jgi:NADH-quinone oxidoreductase subunit E
MLTEEEKNEIGAEVHKYEQRAAACIDALKIVQSHRGWVSDETVKDISEFLDMTPDELDSVATFYSHIYRKPVGKHVILICDSVSCWITGYEKILNYLQTKLGIGIGETTKDGRFTLLPSACIGACDKAPAVIIDNEIISDLDEGKIDDILAQYE